MQAKNLYVSEKEGIQEKDLTVDGESSSTETSASDTDFKEEVKHEWRKARENEVEVIKGKARFPSFLVVYIDFVVVSL